jgi:glycosyltransferase involved in cell wall biosynthesis
MAAPIILSVCIPQYNRCAHLIDALESLKAQQGGPFEVVVSDDGSTDGSREAIPKYLASSGLTYKYIQQPKNLGYDANLRAAMRAATGDYLMALGNDDAVVGSDTLQRLSALLEQHRPQIAIGNLVDAQTDGPVRRVARTELLSAGPDRAISMFRTFSCVTGLVFARSAFLENDTDRYDGSVYVQMYLGARIMAAGGTVLTIDEPIAKIGTSAAGTGRANSYRDKLASFRRKIRPITGGLDEVGRVVCDAIWPYVPAARRSAVTTAVFSQLLMFSYPIWLLDYRQHGSPWAAANLALGCFPSNILKKTDRSGRAAVAIAPSYLAATMSMLVPVRLLGAVKDVARGLLLKRA